MQTDKTPQADPVWIQGPRLRQRWGGMSNSTFYAKIKAGLIPKPEYPFGSRPYWRMDVVERFEASKGTRGAA